MSISFVLAALAESGCGVDDFPFSSPSDASADRHAASPTLGPLLEAGPGSPSPSTTTTYGPPPLQDAGPPVQVDASCTVIEKTEAVQPGLHVPEGTPLTYPTNPPSSGTHYPIWANFQEFDHPIPDGYVVHSMEHGAVVLFYKCADVNTCTPIVNALRKVRDEVATDPACDPSIRARIIIVPRPDDDVPVAAAAWGFTYKADCVDEPSLLQFIRDHYAHGPEDFCNAGLTTL